MLLERCKEISESNAGVQHEGGRRRGNTTHVWPRTLHQWTRNRKLDENVNSTNTDDAMLDTPTRPAANRELFLDPSMVQDTRTSLFAANNLSQCIIPHRLLSHLNTSTRLGTTQLRLLLKLLFPSALSPRIFLLMISAAPTSTVLPCSLGTLAPPSYCCCLCLFFEPKSDERNRVLFWRREGAG